MLRLPGKPAELASRVTVARLSKLDLRCICSSGLASDARAGMLLHRLEPTVLATGRDNVAACMLAMLTTEVEVSIFFVHALRSTFKI